MTHCILSGLEFPGRELILEVHTELFSLSVDLKREHEQSAKLQQLRDNKLNGAPKSATAVEQL